MPLVRGLDHTTVVVPTDRLEEARAFYSGVLGLQEAPRPEEELGRPGIWYRLGDAQLHIQCRDDAPPERSDRHLALVVDDVRGLMRHLRASGVEVLEAPTLLERQRCFCRDPFGNRIEFVALPS